MTVWLDGVAFKTLVRSQQEAVKSPFKLKFFTEPRPQYRTNPLRLKPKNQKQSFKSWSVSICDQQQVMHVKDLCFISWVIQSTINFLMFIPLKLLAKILASAYDFAMNIVVMFINITINKTHNIHDSVYAASTYMIL